MSFPPRHHARRCRDRSHRGSELLHAGERAGDPDGAGRRLSGAGGTDPNAGCRDHPVREGRPGRTSAHDDPRHRPDRGYRGYGPGAGARGLPCRAGLRRLARARAAAEIDRRQAEARNDLENGRSNLKAPAPWSARPASAAHQRVRGWQRCWRASPRCWSPWRWPTRRPAPSGLCWSRAGYTRIRSRQHELIAAAKAYGRAEGGMAQRSARRDRDNRAAPTCPEHAALMWIRSADSHTGPRRFAVATEAGQMAASDHAP